MPMAISPTRMQRLGLILLGLAGCALLGEALTRGALGSSAPPLLSDPSSYADPLCEDAYWALRQKAETQETPLSRHARLGWTLHPDHLNTLGAWKSPPVWSQTAPRLGVFGDSFVQGTTLDGQRLTDHLQAGLPKLQVLGYGVGGYGLGQIVLSMEAHLPKLKGDQAVLGIMLMDLDRSILHFRDGPKPWFSVEERALTLHTDHIDGAEELPAGPRSTFLAWMKHGAWRQIRAKLGWPRAECRVAEKTALTHALIARAADACAKSEVRCTLVLFPHREAYQEAAGWRTLAISEAAESQGLPLLDAGQVWAAAGLGPDQVYASDRHPGTTANATLGHALAQALGENPN